MSDQVKCCGCGASFEFRGFSRNGLPICAPCMTHHDHTRYDSRCPRCRLERWGAPFSALVLIVYRIRFWILGSELEGADDLSN